MYQGTSSLLETQEEDRVGQLFLFVEKSQQAFIEYQKFLLMRKTLEIDQKSTVKKCLSNFICRWSRTGTQLQSELPSRHLTSLCYLI